MPNPHLEKFTQLYWRFSLQWNGKAFAGTRNTIGDACSELGVIVRMMPHKYKLRSLAETLQTKIIEGDPEEDSLSDAAEAAATY
jgi:hypothetical protein